MEQEEMFPKNAFDNVKLKNSYVEDKNTHFKNVKKEVYKILGLTEADDFLMDEEFLELIMGFFRRENDLWSFRLFCIKVAKKLDPLFPYGHSSEFTELDDLEYLLINFVLELYENAINLEMSEDLVVELSVFYAEKSWAGDFKKNLRSYCFLYGHENDVDLSSLRGNLCTSVDKLDFQTAFFLCQLLESTHDSLDENWIFSIACEKSNILKTKLNDNKLILKIQQDVYGFRNLDRLLRWENIISKYNLAKID
jgi:hypothetical protein